LFVDKIDAYPIVPADGLAGCRTWAFTSETVRGSDEMLSSSARVSDKCKDFAAKHEPRAS